VQKSTLYAQVLIFCTLNEFLLALHADEDICIEINFTSIGALTTLEESSEFIVHGKGMRMIC
jgi:hypothetical protein